MFTQLQMTYKTKADEVLDTPATAQVSTAKKSNVNTKNHAMLTAFVKAGKRGLNRFQAGALHDTVLNSTIPVLQKKYAVYFSRERETVPNFTGGTTSVTRYWLDDVSMAVAVAALGG